MNSKMAGINDLPIEIYELIFKDYLSITDLFNCRLVNKKFKFATYRSVQKLVIGDLCIFKNEFWFHNDELINDDHVISLKCFKKIRLRSIFNFDQSLKYLKINDHNDNYNEFKEEYSNLNNLINLECLEINTCMYIYLKLSIKNLKYFKLNGLISTCELNTPKLMKIQFLDQSRIQSDKRREIKIKIKSNPESIKHLIIEDYNDELKQFKNLEIIEFRYLSNLNENLLSFFNNLKQLKIEEFYCIFGFYFGIESKFHLIKILNKSKELNRDIDIYFKGVKIMNQDKIREYELSRNILKFQLDNYDQLDSNITKIIHLDYSEFNNRYNNLRNDLPSSFFDKFQNVSDINITINVYNSYVRPIDADNLNWFLNNLKCLKRLRIKNVLLDQSFFNNLPGTITSLFIRDDESSDLNVNFNFILKLTKLYEFAYSGCNIDLFDLALTSFLNLKYLRTFEFDHKNKLIKIEKENKSIFTFKINFYSDAKLDYDQLIKKCNEFRSKHW